MTIYTPGADKRAMFALPRYVLKAGQIVAEQGEIRAADFGPTLHVEPKYDHAVLHDVEPWFERYASIRFADFGIAPEALEHGDSRIPCAAP